jgi:hypothetical protein
MGKEMANLLFHLRVDLLNLPQIGWGELHKVIPKNRLSITINHHLKFQPLEQETEIIYMDQILLQIFIKQELRKSELNKEVFQLVEITQLKISTC